MSQTTVWDLLVEQAASDPDRVYCTSEGRELTVGEVHRAAVGAAQWCRDRGVAKGDRVAVMLPNSVEHIHLIFGVLAAGAIYVPLNMRANGPGLQHIIGLTEPSLIVAAADREEIVTGAQERAGWSCRTEWFVPAHSGLSTADLLAVEAGPAVRTDLDDVVTISFTSGTTGPPKGVQLTDRMLSISARGVEVATRPSPGDVYLLWEPFYHLGGHQMLVLALRHRVRLAMVPRFSASSFWSDAARLGATHIHYLGGVLQILLKQPPSEADRAHSVRLAWGAGGSGEAWSQFSERFGVAMSEVYGLTETSSINTVNDGTRVGSMGAAANGFAVEVVDSDGAPVAPGVPGEVRIRGTEPGMVTPGYYRNPEATDRLLRGGWAYSGDRAHMDADGYFYFHGRLTDSVRVGGENVSAWEVETVLRDQPLVVDCAMVGVPSPLGEQDIKVFIQRSGDISEQEVIEWCSQRLGSYHLPRYVAWVDDFPRTPSLRIQKHQLSQRTDDCWDRLAHRE